MGGYAASRGVPAAVPATVASGLVILARGVGVALGIWADLGALLVAVFAFPTAVLMHGFWREQEPQARQMEQTHFTKDTALGGEALMLIAFLSYAGDDLGLTITGRSSTSAELRTSGGRDYVPDRPRLGVARSHAWHGHRDGARAMSCRSEAGQAISS
ncbi:DoxX family protein [Streptomyces sp.]|uniref:DoxX family protein n=1 Tax=Streptomyces sp. TaxID=1931 RepID=UPI002F933306